MLLVGIYVFFFFWFCKFRKTPLTTRRHSWYHPLAIQHKSDDKARTQTKSGAHTNGTGWRTDRQTERPTERHNKKIAIKQQKWHTTKQTLPRSVLCCHFYVKVQRGAHTHPNTHMPQMFENIMTYF